VAAFNRQTGSLRSGSQTPSGFVVGALYNRQDDIHRQLGGQWQSGISTPATTPYVIAFTSPAGEKHGYYDYWDDDGIFNYFGEGQVGDMQLTRGNSALLNHTRNGKRILVFQALGGVHRFLGEFRCVGYRSVRDIPDTTGQLRVALVFRLEPVRDDLGEAIYPSEIPWLDNTAPMATVRQIMTTVRTKQDLFRRRLASVERGCRLTGVLDLRFLRASHIKPWADSNDNERVDSNNGLLLTPSADLLFDHGWIAFGERGKLLVSTRLPTEVKEKVGLELTDGRDCGGFSREQSEFLAYHRDCVYEDRGRQGAIDYEKLLD